MKIKEVYDNLCYNDSRNSCFPDFDKETIKPRDNCFCDNCFYDRDILALEILKLRAQFGVPDNE